MAAAALGVLSAVTSGISLFGEVYPLVKDLVYNVESLFGKLPGKQGPSKKAAASAAVTDLVNTYVSAAAQVKGMPSVDMTSLQGHINQLIEAIVGIANDIGDFKHNP